MTMSDSATVSIRKALSADLALRHLADKFFDYLEALSADEVAVDFTGVASISRSFAHQYITRKAQSDKTITETNVPMHVKKMFEIAQRPKAEMRFPEPESVEKIPVLA